MDEWKSKKERGWGICVRVCVCVCVYARFLVVSLPVSCLSTGFHPLVRWCPLSFDSLQTLLYMSIYIHTYSHTSCIRFFFAAFPSMLCETYPPTHARTQTHTHTYEQTHTLYPFVRSTVVSFVFSSSPPLPNSSGVLVSASQTRRKEKERNERETET